MFSNHNVGVSLANICIIFPHGLSAGNLCSESVSQGMHRVANILVVDSIAVCVFVYFVQK